MELPLASRLVKRLGFAAVTTALALGLLEGIARVAFSEDLTALEAPPPQPADGAPTMKGNPYLLWEQAPGVRQEHGVVAHINSMGLRGPEPVVPKPDGVRRVLVTGDSSVYGFGVTDGEPFIDVAAAKLGVEGWNAAIPGYSTYQTINLLEMRALDLEPDVIVVANLWSDNNFDDFVDKDLISAYSSFDGSFQAKTSRVLKTSAFYRVLRFKLMEGSDQAQARSVGWQVGGDGQTGLRRVAIDDYAANLDHIVELAEGIGAEVAFVVLANRVDVEQPGHDGMAWVPYRQVMRDTAARHGAPVLDVPELFAASGQSNTALFLDEMHPTRAGHALIGDALAELLTPWAQGEPLQSAGTGAPRPAYTDPHAHSTRQAEGEHMPSLTLAYTGMQGARLQVDALMRDENGTPVRVGGLLVPSAGTYPLKLQVTEGLVGFVVYDDLAGDGPSSDDRSFDLTSQLVVLPAQSVTLDLDAGTVSAE